MGAGNYHFSFSPIGEGGGGQTQALNTANFYYPKSWVSPPQCIWVMHTPSGSVRNSLYCQEKSGAETRLIPQKINQSSNESCCQFSKWSSKPLEYRNLSLQSLSQKMKIPSSLQITLAGSSWVNVALQFIHVGIIFSSPCRSAAKDKSQNET